MQAVHLRRMERTLDAIVCCGRLFHSATKACWSWWTVCGGGTRAYTRRPSSSQICSMGDMSGERAGQSKTLTWLPWRKWAVLLARCAGALSCWNWNRPFGKCCWEKGRSTGCKTVWMYALAVTWPLRTIRSVLWNWVMPPHTWTLPPPKRLCLMTFLGLKRSLSSRYTRTRPSAWLMLNLDSSEKMTLPHCLLVYRTCLLAQRSLAASWFGVSITPFFGRLHFKPTLSSLRLTVHGWITLPCRPRVTRAVKVAGRKGFLRWIRIMVASSTRVVTLGWPDLGRSLTDPVCRNRCWSLLIVDRLQLKCRATAVLLVPARSMPIASDRWASKRRPMTDCCNVLCFFVLAIASEVKAEISAVPFILPCCTCK